MAATTTALKPWGRFKMISKDPAEESDHIYFYRTETSIGRNSQQSDVVLMYTFISGVHCSVRLDGENDDGEPKVKIIDRGRNGVYINGVRMETKGITDLPANATIHFSKPGLAIKDTTNPPVYQFEILRDGLTPENAELRVQRDASARRPPVTPAKRKRSVVTSTPSSIASTTPGSVVTTTPGSVPTAQRLTGKRQREIEDVNVAKRRRHTNADAHMLEEMDVEITRNLSSGSVAVEASPVLGKRRRMSGQAPTDDPDTTGLVIKANEAMNRSNKELRQKLSEAAAREATLKQISSERERQIETLKDEMQVLDERRVVAEKESELKGQRLADREQQIERLTEEKTDLKHQIEELETDLHKVRKAEAEQTSTVAELKAENKKLDEEMAVMDAKLKDVQAKLLKSEDKYKSISAEREKLQNALDSIQTRNEQNEEAKTGAAQESVHHQSIIKEMRKLFEEVRKLGVRGAKLGKDENHEIDTALQELTKTSDQSQQYSSEQSQPPPTQESYIGDTQPAEGDEEQTLDQDAAAERAGLIMASDNVGPFASDQSRISLHGNMPVDMLEDPQQPISSFSTDMSANETPAEHTEGKSSNSESTLSSNSSSSKTPLAPPLKRQKLSHPTPVLHEEVEETKGDRSDNDAEDEDEGDNDVEETALQEDEEGEHDKENTPVATAASDTTSAKEKVPQPRGQQGWLQMVTTEEDKNEQASASEGTGIFDDETQLSPGP